ncbi:hypothetical protein F0U59_23605 [Archangium gephyra]|nr:hypothetical protein F0U59_23605 [Archangium gephyra]
MFRIAKEQLKALADTVEQSFINRTVLHLREDFPSEIEAHGLQGPALEAMVQRGVAEATAFSITQEDDVRLYIECMLILSPLFSSDPRLPWAAEILRREELSGTAKMDLTRSPRVWR